MALQLQSLHLVAPAFMGLNKDFSGSLLGPEWAVEAQNAVFDRSGRLAARKGWVNQTSTPIATQFESAFEYRKSNGTTEVVSASNNKLYYGVDAPTDITGELQPRASRWQFMNFDGKVVGVQFGHNPIYWDGTDNFKEIRATSGFLPRGDVGLSAFGRLWIVDTDGETIKYSGLLDETDWGSASAGKINMRRIWTNGADKVTGMAALGSTLIVFGSRHIIMWVDGSGSEIGLDPTQMYVVDTVEGTGCICRDSIQVMADGDALFLSNYGLQSLKRVISNKNNPLVSVAPQVLSYMADLLNNEDVCGLRSAYSSTENFYLLSLPQANRTLAFDTRTIEQEGTARVTEWTRIAPRALLVRDDNTMLFGFTGQFGAYSGYTDNGDTYRFVYRSGWMPLETPEGRSLADRLKILKKLSSVIHAGANMSLVFSWAFDFSGDQKKKAIKVASDGTEAEWNVSEWGIGEWSGGTRLHTPHVGGTGTGQFIQVGLEASISSFELSIQNMTVKTKIGRMV